MVVGDHSLEFLSLLLNPDLSLGFEIAASDHSLKFLSLLFNPDLSLGFEIAASDHSLKFVSLLLNPDLSPGFEMMVSFHSLEFLSLLLNPDLSLGFEIAASDHNLQYNGCIPSNSEFISLLLKTLTCLRVLRWWRVIITSSMMAVPSCSESSSLTRYSKARNLFLLYTKQSKIVFVFTILNENFGELN
jgi:hypothetical protein